MTTNNESNLSLELAWAKVLLKSCLDVLETHNETIVKRLRNDVSDFLKDDYNLLKKQKKFNTSEGNVKDDNIKSGKTKHGDFIVKYLEEGSHYKVKEINVMENVAQQNSQTLTEQWKKGELEEYTKYYCKTKWFEDIFQARCYNKDTEDEWWVLKNERYNYNNVYHTNDIEVLAPVPSFEQWNAMLESNDSLIQTINALKNRLFSVAEENKGLKILLEKAGSQIYGTSDTSIEDMKKQLDEALK